ncbi:MAG: succinate dehydrogenase, cytochrome b556 subunit [Pseudomonadota bacterium]
MATADFEASRRPRPLSPHLSIYRPIITMVMSIMHRMTGIMNIAGLVLVVGYVTALALGPEMFALANAIYGSWIGRIILVAFTWSLFHHMFGGIRHAVWDAGRGFGDVRYKMSWATLGGSLAATAILWVLVVVVEAFK